MTQGFFQFNNSIINEIINFVTSPFDLFFLEGPKGSSKSETIEKIIPELAENHLVFRHFCFKNSVIDDFLLNFYDSLKDFSIAQNVSLKKFTTGDFKEKVSHYFRTIGKNCIIIVENFEKVEQNSEITDFLIHLSRFKNIKIIIVSRNPNTVFNEIEIQTYKLEQISKEDFKYKLSILSDVYDDEIKEKFYEMSNGLELYLNMGVKYCTNTGITIPDLINDFERIDDNFEHFIISKFVAMTPSNYREFYKILSVIAHPVSLEFIENYELGNNDYVDYLLKNFLISKFNKEIYVKDYFQEHIKKDFDFQEKTNYCKNLVNIYENELTKSPKDRLLRLSRESIRKEIERVTSLIPDLNSQPKNNISYFSLSKLGANAGIFEQKKTIKDKFNKIKEMKNRISSGKKDNIFKKNLENEKSRAQTEINNKNKLIIIDLINEARNKSANYLYKQSNETLIKAMSLDANNEFRIELCCLIAKNYEMLNEFQYAQNYWEKAKTQAINNHDLRECEILCSIAQLNKKMYKIDTATEQFRAVAANKTYSDKYRAIASIELGEIEEAKGEVENAAEHYQDCLTLSLGTNKQMAAKSYYKLAVLYDESGDIENAIKYYKKNYMLSSEHYENEYYSISLTNLASIYTEQSKYQEASDFLKLALSYDSENNDLENMYYSQKELAKLYARQETRNAISYFKQALDSAKQMKDKFKIALIYFEIGEFYYDRAEDEQSLNAFFSAKKALGNNSKDENIIRINSRIQDIKMRLNSSTFNLIAEKFGE